MTAAVRSSVQQAASAAGHAVVSVQAVCVRGCVQLLLSVTCQAPSAAGSAEDGDSGHAAAAAGGGSGAEWHEDLVGLVLQQLQELSGQEMRATVQVRGPESQLMCSSPCGGRQDARSMLTSS